MTNLNEQILLWPPVAGNEADTLVGSLERQRRTFRWKCEGLDADGLRATTGASSMTLGGLLKHLSFVESLYFSLKLHGRDPGEPWNAVDWANEENWEFRSAAEDSPEELYAMYDASVARARANLAEALADGDLGRPIAETWDDGDAPSIRRMLVDLIEEYARHTGHADILREAVDGRVGEDPPHP
ncbi:MAG: DinB family protein [Nocardioides sp.]